MLIPQIITKDADEFLFAAKYVQKLGYNELNWNLGCPYPMIAKRGMGSGLLSMPDKINEILTRVFAETDIQVSIKMRLGYEVRKRYLMYYLCWSDTGWQISQYTHGLGSSYTEERVDRQCL